MVDIFSSSSAPSVSQSRQLDTLSPEIEMEDHGPGFLSSSARTSSRQTLLDEQMRPPRSLRGVGRLAGVAKHTLGMALLLCVVFLWTMGNFLGSVCVLPSSNPLSQAWDKNALKWQSETDPPSPI